MRCDWFRISSVPAKITSKFSLSLSLSLSLSTDMTNSGGKLMYLFSEGRLKQWSINLLTCKFSKTHKMVRFNVRKYSQFDLNRFYLLFYLLFIYEKNDMLHPEWKCYVALLICSRNRIFADWLLQGYSGKAKTSSRADRKLPRWPSRLE